MPITKWRTRVTRRDIERAREAILANGRVAKKAKAPKIARKSVSRWYGLIFVDSYGGAWINDVFLGKVKEVLPVLRQHSIDLENSLAVLQAIKQFRSEIKSQSCHSNTKNDDTPIMIGSANFHRATFRNDPRFLASCEELISRGLGPPTIKKELKSQGYDVPYRTLARWIQQRLQIRMELEI
jgi:hypothetical protein